MLDYLCDDCRNHFEKVQTLLKDADIPFTVDAGIVRGLDYYTRTVFEISIPGFPALCGGGRYGGLSKQLGGPDVEGIGFAMGLERLIMVMEQQGCDFPEPQQCDLYIASMGEAATEEAFRLTTQLRREGYAVQCDLMGRSVKAQMKYANKIGALYSVVLGDSELEAGSAQLKQMATGTAKPISLLHFLPEFETEMQNGWFGRAPRPKPPKMSIAENYPRQTGTVPAGEGFLLDYSWVQHPIHSYGVFVAPKNDRPGSMTFCCWFAVTPHKMRRRHLISVSAALHGRCFASFVSSRSLALGGPGAQPQVTFAYFSS